MIKKIGVIGVDSGLCWIGDPVNILHKENKPVYIGKDWGEFCETLGKQSPTTKQFDYDKGYKGLGVCVSTGFGDGIYDVMAEIDEEEKRVKKIWVEFY